MTKLVYSEWYGTMSFAQRAAYRKFNVSPSDHDDLERKFGSDHAAITSFVKAHSKDGYYQAPWPFPA